MGRRSRENESTQTSRTIATVAGQVINTVPGLILTGGLAWLSIWLSEYLGIHVLGFEKSPISAVMTAIVLGIAIGNAVKLPSVFTAGVKLSMKKILRLGIIFLGIRLSLVEIAKLGLLGVPVVLGCVAGALFFTIIAARVLHLPERLGILVAVGTSICGVSAIVATGPAIESKEEEIAYAVSIITIFGIVATVAYPYLANALFAGDPVRAGLFLGTAVHDTSQVTGAALLYSQVFGQPATLDAAVVTKLIRNVFMALVIPGVVFYHSRNTATQHAGRRVSLTKFFPLFIVGFLLAALLRTVGDWTMLHTGSALGVFNQNAWTTFHGVVKQWAVNFLVVALAGVGLHTRFSSFKKLGLKPFLVGVTAAVVVGLLSYALVSVFGRFITVV